MKVLRTPDEQFENLAGFPFGPHYLEIDVGEEFARVVIEFARTA